MKYADPKVCPSCRNVLGPTVGTCATCGLALSTASARRLWEALSSADAWLEQARAESQPTPAGLAPHPAPVQPVKRPKTRPALNAGGILLGLGAIFILLAGSILSALALGAFALPFITLLAAGLTFVADWKKLTLTTETLLALTGLMGGLTVGLLAWSSRPGWLVWCLMGLLVSMAFVALTRGARDYVVPRFAAAACATLGAAILASIVEDFLNPRLGIVSTFWTALLALFVLGLAYGGLKRLSYREATFLPLAGMGFALVTAWIAAMATLLAPASASEVAKTAAVPIIILATGLILAARFYGARTRLAAGLTAGALLHYVALAVVLVGYANPVLVAPLALAFASGLALVRTTTFVGLGARVASLFSGFLGFMAYGAYGVPELARTAEELYSSSHYSWTRVAFEPDAQWIALLVTAGLAFLYPALTQLWARTQRPPLSLALALSFLQLPMAAVFAGPSIPSLSVGFGLAALGVLAIRGRASFLALSLILATVAPALLHAGALSLIMALSALALAAIGFSSLADRPMEVWHSRFAGLYAVGAIFMLGIQLNWSAQLHSYPVLLGSLALLALAVLFRSSRPASAGGFELVGAVATTVTLSLFLTQVSMAQGAILFLLAGVSVSLIGILDTSRPQYRLAGAGLLGVAWVLRLAASSVTVPEAYTAPFALVLIAVGLYRMGRSEASMSLPLLAPGLSLALLPSVPWVFADPTSLRALAFALGGLALLAWGSQKQLQAPFLAGVFALGLIALVEIGPYMILLHRWVFIGLIGVSLAAAGATWEARVRDGKAMARYVRNLR